MRKQPWKPPKGLKRIRMNGKLLWDWDTYYREHPSLWAPRASDLDWVTDRAAQIQNLQVYGEAQPDTTRSYPSHHKKGKESHVKR